MSVNLVVDSNLSATEQYVKDASGNTSNLAIGTDSKVGIGTTDPSTKLHLKASTDPEIVLRLDGNTGSKVGEISLYAGYGYIRLYDSGGANTVHLSGGSGGGATGESFFMGHLAVGLNNPAVNDKLTVKSAGTTSSYYGLKVQDSNGNNQLAVRSDGNVGIGTTSPQSKLDINGGLAIGSYAGVNAAPSNGLIASGNVGIGTNNPDSNDRLTVLSAGYSASHFGLKIGDLYGNIHLCVRSDGKVGIGTTILGMPLTVAGGASISGTLGVVGASDEVVLKAGNIGGNNRVGIGTEDPREKLHIVGDIRIDGTTSESAGSIAKYLRINISGTDYKIAIYNAT